MTMEGYVSFRILIRSSDGPLTGHRSPVETRFLGLAD